MFVDGVSAKDVHLTHGDPPRTGWGILEYMGNGGGSEDFSSHLQIEVGDEEYILVLDPGPAPFMYIILNLYISYKTLTLIVEF